MANPAGGSEIPTQIDFDIWMDYAKKNKQSELDDTLVNQYGLIMPEAFSSVSSSPASYAESLRKFLVDDYTMGEDKMRDIYVLRRCSMGLAEAKKKFDETNTMITDAHEFDKGIMMGFSVLVDKFAAKYYADLVTNPQLVVSTFEPVMRVLSKEDSARAIRTFADDHTNRIMRLFDLRLSKEPKEGI